MDINAQYITSTRAGDSQLVLTTGALTSTLTLQDLPEECLRLVLSHLPLVDKYRLESVCLQWAHTIHDLHRGLRVCRVTNSCHSACFCRHPEHRVTDDDWAPQLLTFGSRSRQSPINISTLEAVLRKCGHSLLSLNLDLALIDTEVFEVIGTHCPQLECLSLSSSTGITDQCLQTLVANHGHRLRHLNLQCAANRAVYFTSAGLTQVLTQCQRLTVLFLASIRSQKAYRLNTQHLDLMSNVDYLCAPLPDCMIGDDGDRHLQHVRALTGMSRLVVDGVIYSQSTVQQLFECLRDLPRLQSLTLYTNCDTPLDTELITVAQGLCNTGRLQELYVKVNYITITTMEALSYFTQLKVLDFSLWKPFETGLLRLSLQPLQHCPDLQVLKLSNLLVTDAILADIYKFVPQLRRISLHNMYDMSDDSLRALARCPKLRHIRITGAQNIASDVTENGLISLLDGSAQLRYLQVPVVFDISDDLLSCFKHYAKRCPDNHLCFVCCAGDCRAGLSWRRAATCAGHKFAIVVK